MAATRYPPARLWHHNAVKTECIRGHEFTEDNTYWRADGSRACKRCRADRQRGWL